MFPTTIEEVEAEEKRQAEEAEEITPSLPTAEEILEKLSTTRGAGVPCAVNHQPLTQGEPMKKLSIFGLVLALFVCCAFSVKHKAQSQGLKIVENAVSPQPVNILMARIVNGVLHITAQNVSDETITYVTFKLQRGNRHLRSVSFGENQLVPYTETPGTEDKKEELTWKPHSARQFQYPILNNQWTEPLQGDEEIILHVACFDNGTGWMQGFFIRKYAERQTNGGFWEVDQEETKKRIFKRQTLNVAKPVFQKVSYAPKQTQPCVSQTRIVFHVCSYPECQAGYVAGFNPSSTGFKTTLTHLTCYDNDTHLACCDYDADDYVSNAICP